MTNQPGGESSSGRIHTVQPERDLAANWEVDLANKLEDYLLKICSGEISGTQEEGHIPVNFAEAALLLQGSVQVYSRKVEYLYSLVLHTLEFLSEKRQQDQSKGPTPDEPGESSSGAVLDIENEEFWNLDDIPVDPKNHMESSANKDDFLNHFVKAPANLVVLEGECLDTSGDSGELESYLLATSHLYRDFILLDPCEVVAVDTFLDSNNAAKGNSSVYRGSSTRKSFLSPGRPAGKFANKASNEKNQDANFNISPRSDFGPRVNDHNVETGTPAYYNDQDNYQGLNMDNACPGIDTHDSDTDDDDDDPWKPINPHEPGNGKVRPMKKVKASTKNGNSIMKRKSATTLFPPAKLHGTIRPDLSKIWDVCQNTSQSARNSQDMPLYETLRQSLVTGGNQSSNPFGNTENECEDDGNDAGGADFEPDDAPPGNVFMDEDMFQNKKGEGGNTNFDTDAAFDHGDTKFEENLEDLCRSHLDSLLASIAETENQTELAARVSSWKQNIEHNLEEQDSRPLFDIHEYGERILERLSHEAEGGNKMSFTDAVKGQQKHDVARSFSALLQLVNNGDIELDKGEVGSNPICYTGGNPFHLQLLKRRSTKQVKSPMMNGSDKDRSSSTPLQISSKQQNGIKVGKNKNNVVVGRTSPDSKRRKRSRLTKPIELH